MNRILVIGGTGNVGRHVANQLAARGERFRVNIAAAARVTLCEDGHAGAEYVLTGPQSPSQGEQIQMLGCAAGRSLRIEEISPDEARSELLPILGSPTLINMLLNAWAAAVGQPAFVSSTFAELVGVPPRPFGEWATDHAAEFQA